MVAREHGNIHRSNEFDAAAVLRLLERCDAFRKPQRFREVLLACECDARGRLGMDDTPYPQAARLSLALDLALAVPTADIAAAAQQKGLKGEGIGQAIAQSRIDALVHGGF